MIYEIFFNFLLQVGLTFGAVFAFGVLIAFCNKVFYRNFGSKGRLVCYVTGFVGTPIHELSHALFCVIFRHKITEMKLFQIGQDGTLGYVTHSYNPKNLYHKIGNLFIGTAPILVISALLYFISEWLVPGMAEDISYYAKEITVCSNIGEVFDCFIGIFSALFSDIDTFYWWLFIILGIFLALHMNMSPADMKGIWIPLLILLGIILAVDVVLGIIGKGLKGFTSVFMTVGGFLTSFLLIALVISIIAVIISFVLKITIGRKLF